MHVCVYCVCIYMHTHTHTHIEIRLELKPKASSYLRCTRFAKFCWSCKVFSKCTEIFPTFILFPLIVEEIDFYLLIVYEKYFLLQSYREGKNQETRRKSAKQM